MSHAIVIGGGPAGSLCGLLLARAGHTVELFEQHRFPRDKVCGECLSALGIDVLARAGLHGPLRALGPVVLERAMVHPMDGPTLDVPLPRPMWGLTRYEMDRALLAAAVSAGVVVYQPARCEAVLPGKAATVRWRDLGTNRVTSTSADWIILADGKGALLPTPRPATGDLGVKTHFVDVNGPRDAIELFAGPGCYGGIAPVEGQRWNAAFNLPADLLRSSRGDVDAAFSFAVAHNPALACRLRGARQIGRWLAAPLARFTVCVRWPEGVYPVGNAAAALEPIGGEGMGLALRSAELIAAALDSGRHAEHQIRPAFDRLWAVRRAVCRAGALTVINPQLTAAIGPLLQQNDRLTRAIVRWAGKTSGRTDAWFGQ